MERHPEARHQTNLTVGRLLELLSTVDPKTVVCGRIPETNKPWSLGEDEIWLDLDKGIIVIGD